ncbi:hypothetical protein ACFVT1_03995 [Streptomyces sp. NPDC057963]|uniref:hypothetical protein n=1 Tax=Streptomyces sp. NPDC057963 TaxID=3346290 RepID=UPI0036E8B191
MGLMSWLRGGGRTETGTGTGTGASAEVPRENPVPFALPRERIDLGELPPLQRMLGQQDLVIDPRGFQGSLATRQDPALGTPLGHLVSPDAPTGLVHGITTPAPGERTPPVQRAVERAVERSVEFPVRGRSVSGSVSGPVPVSVPVQRAEGGDAPAMTSAGEAAAAEWPVRQLVGEQPFVPASTAPGPQPESAPMSVPLPSSASGPASASASASTATPAPAAVQRAVTPPAAERSRRTPGLGAPMSALPPTAQRQTAVPDVTAGAVPVARSRDDSGAGEIPGVTEDTGAQEAPAAPDPAPDAHAPTAPLLGDDPLLPAPSEPAPVPASAPVPISGPAVQRTPVVPGNTPLAPPPATGPVAPLLADRPLALRSRESGEAGGAAAVQRSIGGGGAAAPSAGTVHGSPPDAVPVRWTPAGTGVPSVAATAPVPTALQRTVAPSGQAPGAVAPPRPALQRQAVGGPPVPRSLPDSGSRTASSAASPPAGVPAALPFPTAGSVAVAAGVAQRMADGSVVFGSPPTPYAPAVVQREAETAEPPPPEPPREPEAAPEPEPEPEPVPGPAAEEHGAPGSPTPATAPGGPPVVTDELVRALYPPLSRLFKADLRLERERAGFLIDTRHS